MNKLIKTRSRVAARYPIILVASLSIAMSGCASGTGGGSSGGLGSFSGSQQAELTPAQQQMRSNADAFNRTVWGGVATGAVAGAVAGFLFGGDLKSALIGGAGGAVVGGLAGNYFAGKQQQYASKEAQLDAVIADLRQKNAEGEQLVASLETVVAEHRLVMAELNTKYQAGTVDEATYRRRIDQIGDDQRLINESIDSANEQLNTFQDTRTLVAQNEPAADLSEMDAELERMSASTQRLATLNDELAATRGAV